MTTSNVRGPVFLSDNIHLWNYVQYVKQHSTHNYHCRTADNWKSRVVKSDCCDKTWHIAFSMAILCSDRPQSEPHPDYSTRAPATFYQKLKTPFLYCCYYYHHHHHHRIFHFSALARKYSSILGCSNQQD